MGWLGCSSESPKEAIDWDLNFCDKFIKEANPDHFIVMVDCHI